MIHAYAEAKYDALHKAAPFHDGSFKKWSAERSPQTPFHYRDGVTLWVAETDLTPHDHFLGGARDCADCQTDDEGFVEPDDAREDEEVPDGGSP